MKEFLADWPSPLRNFLLQILGINRANRLLAKARLAAEDDGLFISRVLARQNVKLELTGDLPRLQAEPGPVIFVGNHPHGLLDALALASLAEQSGQSFVLLARHFLTVFEPLRPNLLPLVVNPDRRATNGSVQFEAALQALATGHSLVITPAGRLSLPATPGANAQDAPWRTGAVRLARASGATLIPVTLELKVGRWVYITQKIHPVLRSVFQVWRVLLRRPERIRVQVHAPLPASRLQGQSDRAATTGLQETVCGRAPDHDSARTPSSTGH